MHQDMGDLGLDVRNLDLLMKTGFGILAPQRGLAVRALFRESLDRHLWWEGSVDFHDRLTASLFLGSDPVKHLPRFVTA